MVHATTSSSSHFMMPEIRPIKQSHILGVEFGLLSPAQTFRRRNQSIQVAGMFKKKHSIRDASKEALGLMYSGPRFHAPFKSDKTSPT